MKTKLVQILFMLAVAGTATLSAQDTPVPEKVFSVDGAAGLSFGLFDSLNNTAFGDLSALATIASLRGGGDATLLYKVNEIVGVGPSLGLYILQYSVNGGSTYTFFDIPIRAVAKVGVKGAFVQPFLGYYLTPVGFPFPGMEVGARGVLGSFFLEGSYVLGTPNWKHISFGIEAADLFQF